RAGHQADARARRGAGRQARHRLEARSRHRALRGRARLGRLGRRAGTPPWRCARRRRGRPRGPKRRGPVDAGPLAVSRAGLLLGAAVAVAEALLELLDAALGVDEALLAREERVVARPDVDVQLGLGAVGLHDDLAVADDLGL